MLKDNLLDWDKIIDDVHKDDQAKENDAFERYLNKNQQSELEQLKWAASHTSEIDTIRDRIGAEFDKLSPINLKLYSVELYVLDENSSLLTIRKIDKIASDLDGKVIDFYLTDNPSISFSDTIKEGEVVVNFQRLGISILDYSKVSFRIHLDETTVVDGKIEKTC
jgi:hypothetical protein